MTTIPPGYDSNRREAPAGSRLFIIGSMVFAMGLAMTMVNALQGMIRRFHVSRCPTDSFIVGDSGGVVIALLIFMLIAFWGTIYILLLRFIPGGRELFYGVTPGTLRKSYHSGVLKGFAIGTIILAAITLPLVPFPVFDQFCLTPRGLLNQDEPWSGLRPYGWSQVKEVRAECNQSKRGWTSEMDLIFSDDREIDLRGGTVHGDWTRVYARIAPMLHGQAFTFETRDIEPGCAARELPYLVNRP